MGYCPSHSWHVACGIRGMCSEHCAPAMQFVWVHDLDYFLCKKIIIKYNLYTKILVIYSTLIMLSKRFL